MDPRKVGGVNRIRGHDSTSNARSGEEGEVEREPENAHTDEEEPLILLVEDELTPSRASIPPGPTRFTDVTQRQSQPVGQFHAQVVKPIMPFLRKPYLLAQTTLRRAHNVRVFHMRSIYVARQALHLVILLNDAIDVEDGPDDEHYDERNELEDELMELLQLLKAWSSDMAENVQSDYDRFLMEIEQQYAMFFKERFYFHDTRDSSTDPVYQKHVAYDTKTIEFRQCQGTHSTNSATVDGDLDSNLRRRSAYAPTEAPLDPGPVPSVKDLGLSKQEKTLILDDWQRESVRFQQHKGDQETEVRPPFIPPSRYNYGQYAPAPSDSGYGSQPSSEINPFKLYGPGMKVIDNAGHSLGAGNRRISAGALGLAKQRDPRQPQVPTAPPPQSPPAYSPLSPSHFVPITTVGEVETMAIPISHLSQFPGFMQDQPPSIQAQHTTSRKSYLAPAFMPEPKTPEGPQPPQRRRKANIADVINATQQQNQRMSQQDFRSQNLYINSEDIMPPAPPKEHPTANIGNFNSAKQPVLQARPSGFSQDGYIVAPASNTQSSARGDQYKAHVNPAASSPKGNTTGYPMRLDSPDSDTLETTGPQGFRNQPKHPPSHKSGITHSSHSSSAKSGTSSTIGTPVVSMRRPNPDIRLQHFPPTIITYDLNGEHRQESPLRFGRFVYERDCTHKEWGLFAEQILDAWAARDPAYNRYHTATKGIDAILSAWNFAFFSPRGMDVVLFKGNERRSGPRFGEPELAIGFHEEASPASDRGEVTSSEESEDEAKPADYLAAVNLQYRAQIEREKSMRSFNREQGKRRERAARPLEAPHSLVIYDISSPSGWEHIQTGEPEQTMEGSVSTQGSNQSRIQAP